MVSFPARRIPSSRQRLDDVRNFLRPTLERRSIQDDLRSTSRLVGHQDQTRFLFESVEPLKLLFREVLKLIGLVSG
jgi:hypothetical protein